MDLKVICKLLFKSQIYEVLKHLGCLTSTSEFYLVHKRF